MPITEDVTAHDVAVRERWTLIESDGRLQRVVAIINERAIPLKVRHDERVNRVINHTTMTTGAKIEALWEAVDEIGEIAKPHTACRKGCSHCCHTPVLVPVQEAELIGRRIGVKPVKLTGISGRDDIEAGYHNPCTFLDAHGACSIYSSRPLACRQLFNMDRDALLCELVGETASKVPYMNMFDYQTALAMTAIDRRESVERNPRTGRMQPRTVESAPVVGDIREFFPRGKG
ncbi:YkgJ family cysteine cluster protein [Paraburkholderia sp. HD33-4]|uniref:YkgJ family cysteine cluster protein n=1 Tax=Paraburkholderia sp. HD33-4 TaxID=2883242 RepID=UPI001F41FA51|nr:YkgJ family cysteine cluster protein [Paraburkholderia sp. HD33-4]